MNTEKINKEEVREKMMTVHSSDRHLGIKSVPIRFFNDEHAKAIHSQTLERLNERGGMGLNEMVGNIQKLTLRQIMDLDSKDAIIIIKKLIDPSIKDGQWTMEPMGGKDKDWFFQSSDGYSFGISCPRPFAERILKQLNATETN